MSIFSATPDPFPLNVPLKARPVTFTLKSGLADRIPTIALSIFWSILGTSVLFGWADPWAPWTGEGIAIRGAALGALVVFLVFGVGGWLWPATNEVMRKVAVTIGEAQIHVTATDLLGTRSWSRPLSDYEGLLIENWGTRSVGKDKVAVSAVVLKHRDDRWTIPLVIDGALRVKPSAAARKAQQLGLQLLEDAPVMPDGAPIDQNRLVVNRFQARKVRALYAIFCAGGVATAAWLAPQAASDADPALWTVTLLALTLAIAMHVFASRYVVAMEADAGGVTISTAELLAPKRQILLNSIRSVAYRESRSTTGTVHSVHAPWVKIRIEGHFLPYIVDMQSDYVNEAALQNLPNRAA